MLRMLAEKVYTQYEPKYPLNALREFIDEIPNLNKNLFMKMLVFTSQGVGIYNIGDIKISPCIGEGTAAETAGKKNVKIIYTGDETSKVMTIGTFADYIKKILDNLEDVNKNDVLVEVACQGKENKGQQFRFYYDDTKNYAILVRGTGPKGAEEFMENYEGDLVNAIQVAKTREFKSAGPKASKQPKKADPHEGYILKAVYDDYGHKIRMWQKIDPKDKEDMTTM